MQLDCQFCLLYVAYIRWIFSFINLSQELGRCEDDLSTYKSMREQGASPQLEADIKRLERAIEILSQDKLCYEAQILRVRLICTTMDLGVILFDFGLILRLLIAQEFISMHNSILFCSLLDALLYVISFVPKLSNKSKFS